MYDDTDMNNLVTYYTYLEDWIFKILLMEIELLVREWLRDSKLK